MKSPFDPVHSVVALCDRVADDPQAREEFLRLMGGLAHGAVTSHRDVLPHADARDCSFRPVRNPIGRQRVATGTTTVQLTR